MEDLFLLEQWKLCCILMRLQWHFAFPGLGSSHLKFHPHLLCSTASQLEFPAAVWFLSKTPLLLHMTWITRVTDFSGRGKQEVVLNGLLLESRPCRITLFEVSQITSSLPSLMWINSCWVNEWISGMVN